MDKEAYLPEEMIGKTALPAWKMRAIVIGGVLGAVVGGVAAYLYVQNSNMSDDAPQISAGEGVKLGVLVFGLLRSIATLGEGK